MTISDTSKKNIMTENNDTAFGETLNEIIELKEKLEISYKQTIEHAKTEEIKDAENNEMALEKMKEFEVALKNYEKIVKGFLSSLTVLLKIQRITKSTPDEGAI